MRMALGAGRGQLALHYFAEGLLISLAAAAGGIFLGVTLTPAIVSMAADYLPRAEEITMDWTVLLFVLGAACVASVLSSLAPLWQAARTAPADALGEGVRTSGGRRTRRASQLLVVAEIALAFALLAVSAILILHLRSLSRTSPGFDADGALTFVISVPYSVARDPAQRVPLQRRLVAELKTIPGADAVGLANQLPFKGCCLDTAIFPEGRLLDPGVPQRTSLMAISSGYFDALRIPLQSGRLLTDLDYRPGDIPVVINQAAAKQYWSDRNPVGAYGRFEGATGDRFQVVGVVGDVRNDGLRNPVVPEIYVLAFSQRIESMQFVVRSSRPPASLMTDVRRVIHGIDPEQPIHQVATMPEIIRQTVTLERAASFLTAFFAGAALLMAMLGVYGVVSYSVRQRTVEIGMRMALGATGRGVLSMIVGDGLKMAAYGVIAGGIAALAAASYLGRVFELGSIGPAPFIYSTGIVAAVAFAASILPAWRAALLSPLAAIRN
jgi:predicted permease